jgi:hypothetical protein
LPSKKGKGFGFDLKLNSGKDKKKNVSNVLLAGACLVVLLTGFFTARLLFDFPFPFMTSNAKPAPEGVALTISLLAFCKDNSTEVLATKEYRLSQLTLLTTSGKEIKYFAITCSFLSGPVSDEVLQKIDLTYEIKMSTDRGMLQTVTKSVSLPIIANLALHQSAVIPITPQELGLNTVGDVALLTSTVKVEADMTTDQGRKVFTSSGNVETRLAYQEGGFLRSGPVSGQVSEEGTGSVVAVLTGTWQKPSWRAITVVGIVDDNTGAKAYMIAEAGDDSVHVTTTTPTPGSTVPTTEVQVEGNPPGTGITPPPTTPTQTTAPSTVTIPPYETPPNDPSAKYEYEPPTITEVEYAESYPYGYESGSSLFSLLPAFLVPLVAFFNGYRMLWPIYIFGRTYDLAFVGALVVSILLVILGAALSKKKK